MDTPRTTTWHSYLTPGEAWDAMYRDCEQAQESIECEQYIFENDILGRKFMNLFVEKATQGIRVFVICDTFGSFSFHGSRLVRKFRRQGGRFHFYHPVNYWNLLTPWRWFPRTHVKTLLVDSKIAYTGGVCLAQRMRDWRDTQIRFEGPVVEQVRIAFENARRSLYREKRMEPSSREDEFVYIQNQPRTQRYMIYRELLRAVTNAKQYIYISTAFFAPNRQFFKALNRARMRGVDIKLLVPEHSDVAFADWVRLSYASRLLKAGVRIFHYQPTVMHNKIMMVDDNWATIGSTNMDIISFFRNRESNLIVTHKPLVLELKDHFLKDLTQTIELTPELVRGIPLWKIIGGYMGRVVKFFF